MVIRSIALISTMLLAGATASAQSPSGDPDRGHDTFAKLRCDTCHSVAGQAMRGPHPLPDLSSRPPDAIASSIVEHANAAPQAPFDNMAMSVAVSRMTTQDLADITAYLKQAHHEGR